MDLDHQQREERRKEEGREGGILSSMSKNSLISVPVSNLFLCILGMKGTNFCPLGEIFSASMGIGHRDV